MKGVGEKFGRRSATGICDGLKLSKYVSLFGLYQNTDK